MNTIKVNSKSVKMIAHRGLSGLERENTAAAFVAAGNRSYFGIETDIHKTADGKFVVIHDETTERVSGGAVNINVESVTRDEIEKVTLPDIDGSENRADIKIPFLKDYIKICKKYEKVCVLELKNAFEKEDIVKIIDEINEENYLENVIFISFVRENCTALRSLLKENDIQFLTGDEIDDALISWLKKENLNLDIYYKQLTKENVKKLHKNGIKVNCWTCDNKEEAEKLIKMGVDFITSNILE